MREMMLKVIADTSVRKQHRPGFVRSPKSTAYMEAAADMQRISRIRWQR